MNFRSGADFVLCWGNKIEGVVLLQGMYFRNFFPNQGQVFKLSVTHLYPNIGLVPPPPPSVVFVQFTQVKNLWLCGITSWVYSFPFYAG